MLSAFTARPIVELKQRDKSKIESILAYGDRLIVGLNTGSLRIYRVNEIPEDKPKPLGDEGSTSRPSSSSTPKPVDLLRELEKFSPRAIEQLSFLKVANTLISLSNYIVSLHDLKTYELQEQLAKTKNAMTFAVTSNIVKEAATGIPEVISRLAVAVKRRLLLWDWHESELSPDVTEITLPAAIRTLCWASAAKIICGTNSGYYVVDVVTQEIADIVGPGAIGGASETGGSRFGGVGSASMGYMGLGGYTPKPLITRLQDGELLLAKDINSMFVDADGKPIEKRQIPWQQAPESVGYSYPYLLSLQPLAKGVLEVRNPETLSLLQTISLPNANALHFPPPTVSVAHGAKGFHVASDRIIWRMGTTDYDSQIDELVEGGKFDEAISIMNSLEDALLKDKEGRLREVKMLKAQSLFDQQKYRPALDLFTEVSAPPERVIKLYPPIIAGELSSIPVIEEPEVEEPSEIKENGSSPPEPVEEAAPVGSPAKGLLSNFMRQHKRAAPSDASSIMSKRSITINKESDDSDTASVRQNSKPLEEGLNDPKILKTAVRELNGFLVDTRTRLQRFLDPATGKLKAIPNGTDGTSKAALSLLDSVTSAADVQMEEKLVETAKLVDTTLFRAYMLVQPSLAGSLFRIPNFCDPGVVNEKLLENNRLTDLVDFFHGKKLHREALELLKRYGQAEEPDEAAPALHGPERTVGYLQNLNPEHIDLILEFAQWPLEADPKLGMEIFLTDTENAETLPREKVVKFLEGIDVGLATRYLEHIIHELNDMTPDFHNRLVGAYIKELEGRQDRDSEEWKELMHRALEFLKESKQYFFPKALALIPRDDAGFYEAQAIILSNMKQHKQALEIYVFKLKDPEKAEEYCNRMHLLYSDSTTSPAINGSSRPSTPQSPSRIDKDDQEPSIYHTLLSLYLTPPAGHEPQLEPALDLLSKHGSRLPALSTLGLIPGTLPVSDLESYFRGRIRAANSIVNQTRIVAGLRRAEAMRTTAALLGEENLDTGNGAPRTAPGMGGRSRHVVVSEERVCGVCHKRLGRSVVSVLPDNSVVHYACGKKAVAKGMGILTGLGGGSFRKDSSMQVKSVVGSGW